MGAALTGLNACSDFEDINRSPSAAGQEYIHPDYPLNKSFYEAQMDPDIAERVFVYNWASISRTVGDNTFGASARYSNEYNDRLYSYTSNWVKYATNAIQLADENEPADAHQAEFWPNVKQFARIWRVMLIADFTDSFGPYPLDGFEGHNPTFNSVQEVYDYMLKELKEAAAAINTSVEPTTDEAKGDPAFGYNAEKWIRLANSLRMRYALRISEVDAAKAKSEFEAAASGMVLTEGQFSFPEAGGWSAYEGVMNRSWSDHTISATMVNLLTGLGSTPVTAYRPDLADYIKPMNYLGEKYDKHFPVSTDNPTKFMWMDGIPEILDPRALVCWNLPNDQTPAEGVADIYRNYSSQASQTVKNHASHAMLDPTDSSKKLVEIDAQYTWNGYPSGVRGAWSSKTFKLNDVLVNMWDTTPFLAQKYRNNTIRRIWMSNWETYFLLAEGAVRGWATPMSAKAAYDNGVTASFAYHGVEAYAAEYLASENYNRVGTSAKFNHTTEPVAFEADYKDGYTKAAGKMTYNYPDASKILYKGGKLNDQLTKIITQKYIANMPYGAVEMWNDHRRLGLPFWEIPGNDDDALTGSDMDGLYTQAQWINGQKWYHYTQRMRYTTALENSDKEQYQNALQLLGAETNNMMTPLWWAIH